MDWGAQWASVRFAQCNDARVAAIVAGRRRREPPPAPPPPPRPPPAAATAAASAGGTKVAPDDGGGGRPAAVGAYSRVVEEVWQFDADTTAAKQALRERRREGRRGGVERKKMEKHVFDCSDRRRPARRCRRRMRTLRRDVSQQSVAAHLSKQHSKRMGMLGRVGAVLPRRVIGVERGGGGGGERAGRRRRAGAGGAAVDIEPLGAAAGVERVEAGGVAPQGRPLQASTRRRRAAAAAAAATASAPPAWASRPASASALSRSAAPPYVAANDSRRRGARARRT